MAKRFSPKFKQQATDYAFPNLHESLATIAVKLGVGYSTLDKWVRMANPEGSNKRQLHLTTANLSARRKQSNSSKRQITF